ncbi:TRAP transporter large permease [Chachezhania sediminis]|uniref:TRAP transporter large permease n=1 Tax=Chachezhania sediminis TaxID=2599291 RepID=UPI00131D5786|nr:TRAP transporter large permease [Chachezhania sediminis]
MTEALIGVLAAFVLIFARVPLAVALGLVGFFGFGLLLSWRPAFAMVALTTKSSLLNYYLSVIPLFVLMGNFLTRAGISGELYRAAYAVVGHLRGGISLATVVACGGFSAVCGSSLATAATMAKVAMPSMREFGYDDRLATGSIAAGGTLGILIPPSVILIIYGVITETNIGMLFAAGMIPGLIGLVGYMIAVRYVTWRNPAAGPAGPRMSWAERMAALKGVWAVLLLFGVVIGGIYGGLFTPTEAAGVGAGVSFLFALARRSMSFRDFLEVLVDSARTSGVMFAVLIGATIFSEFINYTGMHTAFLDWVSGQDVQPWLVIVVIVLIYLVLGCVLESLSMILLTVPIFFPIIVELGFDPVWFGIVVVVSVEIGLLTPPIGINVFVLRSVLPDVATSTIFRGVVPFWIADIIRIALLTGIPAISLFLPRLLF